MLFDIIGLLRATTPRDTQTWLVAICFVMVCFALLWIVYTFTLHPLALFPGPRLAKISQLYYARIALDGKIHQHLERLHRQYGDIVRISPNELSFACPEALKDIYNTTGDRTFTKSEFYKTANFNASDIIGESDVNEHARMRKLWAHGFSARALISHEKLEDQYVELLIRQIRKHGINNKLGINVVDWFNYMTFDIIGELVFGESFRATETGSSAFWIDVILKNMKGGVVVDILRRFGIFVRLKKLFQYLPVQAIKDMDKHAIITREMAAKRLSRPKNEQKQDFLKAMIDNAGDGVITTEEVAAQGQNLLIAGSETTATTLSAVTYFLMKNPSAYAQFRQEVRESFRDYSQITSSRVGQLPFFHAVINETLRLYPPVPFGPPRVSPGAYVAGKYIPKGTEVSVHAWTINRDPRVFSDPLEFRPQRWLEDEKTSYGQSISSVSFPFLLGPRVCLGKNLAFIELRLTLAKLNFLFDMEMVNEEVDLLRDSNNFILWQKPAVMVKFTERKLSLLDQAESRDSLTIGHENSA